MYLMNFEDAETRQPGDPTEHEEDEDQAGRVEGEHQLAKRQQGADAVLADGERHRAESADRRDLHDDADHVEQHVRCLVDEIDHRPAALAEH